MVSINAYLDRILVDFKKYVNSDVELCNLKSVHFDGGKLPDYSDIHAQQYYLLRYAYAYGFEYKQMYKGLRNRIKDVEHLRVTSIGCGSMIDYWALTRVFPRKCSIRYTGIDTIDWSYRIEPRPQDEVNFCNSDVVSLFENAETLTSDVYIFPKSISEFSKSDIQRLGNCLSKKLPTNQTVFFLFSLRTDEWHTGSDKAKTKILFDCMVNAGYETNDKCDEVWVLPQELRDKKIREVDCDFSHPSEVYDFLKNGLHKCCSKYLENGVHCKSDCKTRLSWAPILSCKQVQWQIFEFRREESL
jgi:hypothetical protein